MLVAEGFTQAKDNANDNPSRPFSDVIQDILRGIIYAGIFVIPLVPLIVTNWMAFPDITGKNFAFRVVVETIFAAWILLALYDSKYQPRFSWILGTLSIFVATVFCADIFGVDAIKSLWGNYERMGGFITIVHLFMYFMVVSSTLKSKRLWHWLFTVSLAVAVIASLLALQQADHHITERIGGTLGKSTFLAIYMLIHTFISFLMLTKTKNNWIRFLYGAIAVLFAFTLFQTLTRGTVLGLIGSLCITTLYIAIFGRTYKTIHKIAIGGLVSVILLTGSFIAVRNTDFVQKSPVLNRLASISLDAGEARFALWKIAYEGFQERPLLGWGQENYNYVFNKYYDPSLYSQEQWFDRAHNTFLEWLIAGGVLGLGAYLALFSTILYYLAIKPLFKKDDETFTPIERGILLGLLSGYLIHNLFAFDEIVSYICCITILSFIHVRVSASAPQTKLVAIPENVTTKFVTPLVAVGLITSLYFINIPRIHASTDFVRAHTLFDTAHNNDVQIINGLRHQLTPEQRNMLYVQATELFDSALTEHRFADQEIVEQLALIAPKFLSNEGIPAETKEAFTQMTEKAFSQQTLDRPNDAKLHAFAGSFYGSLGDIKKALEHYQRARELSPRKQPILLSMGVIYMRNGQLEEAKSVFKEAFEYAPEFSKARNLYAISAIYTGDWNLFTQLIDSVHEKTFLQSDLGVKVFYSTGNLTRLEPMLIRYVEAEPRDLQKRILLASVQSDLGNNTAAIQTTRETMALFPQFKAQGEKIIEDLSI